MEIKGNTIIFKSTPENYYKEFHGWKCNTVRRLKDVDELNKFNYFKNHLTVESKIKIETQFHSGDKASFERQITDITQFEDVFIISWKGD